MQLAALLHDVDLLTAPVMSTPAPSIEDFNALCEQEDGLIRLVSYICLHDMPGSPTITLPAGIGKDGEPVAWQLIGR